MEKLNKKILNTYKKYGIFAAVSLLLVSCSAFVFAADLKIQADRQSFKAEENKAKFEGNVKVE